MKKDRSAPDVATGNGQSASPASEAGPDVAQLAATSLPSATFPAGRGMPFRVFFAAELHGRLWQHAQETTAVEICGVLVGTWGRDEAGPFVSITESIRGQAAASKFAEVTFTHETWAKINQEMDTRLAHLTIVGWYHSHPDFGIFLSDRDVFIQQHFFANPGQVALVVDPVRMTEGTFIWQKGKPALLPHYWVGEQIQVGGAVRCDDIRAASAAQPTGASHAQAQAVPRSEPASSYLGSLTQVFAYLALFLLGFLLAGRLTDSERVQMVQDAVAKSSLLLGIKPGLREGLDGCLADLAGLARNANALAQEHQKIAGDLPEAQQGQWNEVRSGLDRTRRRLAELQSVYCLTPAETERTLQFAAVFLAGQTPGMSPRQREQLASHLLKALEEGNKRGLFEIPLGPDDKAAPSGNDQQPAAKKSDENPAAPAGKEAKNGEQPTGKK